MQEADSNAASTISSTDLLACAWIHRSPLTWRKALLTFLRNLRTFLGLLRLAGRMGAVVGVLPLTAGAILAVGPCIDAYLWGIMVMKIGKTK